MRSPGSVGRVGPGAGRAQRGPLGPSESNHARWLTDLLFRAAEPGKCCRPGRLTWRPGGDPAGPDRIAQYRLVAHPGWTTSHWVQPPRSGVSFACPPPLVRRARIRIEPFRAAPRAAPLPHPTCRGIQHAAAFIGILVSSSPLLSSQSVLSPPLKPVGPLPSSQASRSSPLLSSAAPLPHINGPNMPRHAWLFLVPPLPSEAPLKPVDHPGPE
jgi:hypothetical protein